MSNSYKVYASQEYVDSKIEESRVQSDWNQNDPASADFVKNRTHCTEDAMEFPWHMTVDTDAPAAMIYKQDGTETGVRWVKVSDYTPDAERVIEHCTVRINEYSTQKIAHEDIFDHDEDGYQIAEETSSGLRRIFAVVCFKAGHIVNGYPAYQRPENYTATLSESGLYLPVGIDTDYIYYGLTIDEYVKPLDDKYISAAIARKSDLESIEIPDPVTDEHINVLIDHKLAGFGGVYLLGEQELSLLPDGNGFAITTPWANPIVGGAVYKVDYNGTEYDLECIALPADMDMPDGMFVMGNLSALGMEGGNPDVPFAIIMYQYDQAGLYGGVIPLDEAATVTLSIRRNAAGYYFFDGNVAKIVTIDQLKADLGLPTPTAADAGKILRVNAEGKYELVSP